MSDFVELNGYKVKDVKAREMLYVNGTTEPIYITPQMFGAVGDGVSDDTNAIEGMITFITEKVPTREYKNEVSCKDFSRVKINFCGSYKVSRPIVFNNTYGLIIEGLNLIAGSGFTGSSLLAFKNVTRNLRVINMSLNGSYNVDTCLHIEDYTLNTDFINVEISHFKKYGFYAIDKGHELKIVNMKINQCEWGELSDLTVNVTEGTGFYLDTERYDNNITQLIVNYCKTRALHIKGGSNTFLNCHFYGGYIDNAGHYNFYQNCYFDCVPIKTVGFFQLNNCMFIKDQESNPFIYLTETDPSYDWRYSTSAINGCVFKSTDNHYVNTPIDLGVFSTLPRMNTIGNTFYYSAPFNTLSDGSAPNPWMLSRGTPYGNTESGHYECPEFKCAWGTTSTDQFCYYGITITEIWYVGCTRLDNNSQYIPFPGDISSTRFWLNNTSGGTVKWFVIGR